MNLVWHVWYLTVSSSSLQLFPAVSVSLQTTPLLNAGLGENSTDVPSLCMRRTGLINIPVTVSVQPRGITATEDQDFVTNENQIVFFPSRFFTDEVCSPIAVTILDDLVVESNETMELLAVSSEPSRITIDSESMSVAIIDNDSEFWTWILTFHRNEMFGL